MTGMTNKYNLSDTYIEIYYKSNQEFERVRDICLQENNWLRDNYTKENLIVEEHTGYGVVYQASTDRPMVMAGMYRSEHYPYNVARNLNRLYVFPDFRSTAVDMLDGFRVVSYIADELMEINSYDLYFITMQNRKRGGKRWWTDVWVKNMQEASGNRYTLGDGYIQTCNANVKKCWQNYVYLEAKKGSFAEWNPKLIYDDEWATLKEGN